jgi:hypothetical protein
MSVTTPSNYNSGSITALPSALACWPACTSTWLMSIGGARSGVRGKRLSAASNARSVGWWSSRAVRGSGRCGASPALER